MNHVKKECCKFDYKNNHHGCVLSFNEYRNEESSIYLGKPSSCCPHLSEVQSKVHIALPRHFHVFECVGLLSKGLKLLILTPSYC